MQIIKNLLQELYQKNNQLIVYLLIGALSASLDFLVFNILIKYIFLPYILANAISVNFGILNSFFLNLNYNFKTKNLILKRFVLFYLVGASGLLLSSALLFFLVDHMLLNKSFSKLITIFFVAFFQFSLNKLITFKSNTQ